MRMATASAVTSTSSATASTRPLPGWSAPTRGSTSATNISTTAAPPTAAFRRSTARPVRGFTRDLLRRSATTASPGPTSTSRPRRSSIASATGSPCATGRCSATIANSTRTSTPTARAPSAGTCRSGSGSARYNNRNDRTNLFSQTDLVWENRLAGIDQTMLFGFEVGRQAVAQPAHHRQHCRPTCTTMRCRSPIRRSTSTSASRRRATDANNRVHASVAAVYVQDQIRPAKWIEMVAGLRFDSFKLEVDDFRTAGGGSAAATHLWSPRLGLVLKPTRQPVALHQLQPLLSAAVGRPVQRPRRRHLGAEARAVRQLRSRREMGAARRAARDRRGLPARPHQHARRQPRRQRHLRAERRAAQPRARARARAQRHQPLADLGRLRAAEGRPSRARRPPARAAAAKCRWCRATASRCGTATT